MEKIIYLFSLLHSYARKGWIFLQIFLIFRSKEHAGLEIRCITLRRVGSAQKAVYFIGLSSKVIRYLPKR